MTYTELVDFIERRMRMSHIYQPVMMMTLLQHNGQASTRDIAKAILHDDQSQIEYYENITRNMVGRVLRNHGIVTKEGKDYVLAGHEALTKKQSKHLMDLCQQKLDAYLQRRGNQIWQHRTASAGYVSGTLRYDVLKRAQFHCELCGISADLKALEVDHIVPRNKGGSDDPSNLQALCYSCNAMKRDRDDTDFRAVRDSYQLRKAECPFCQMESARVVGENELAYVIRDGYPVTPMHTLVIPKRHVPDYFSLSRPELNACNDLLQKERKGILERDEAVKGFNLGVNNGEHAGQTIFHCHIHLIPRRVGDVENPRGGVRHTIPGKGHY